MSVVSTMNVAYGMEETGQTQEGCLAKLFNPVVERESKIFSKEHQA